MTVSVPYFLKPAHTVEFKAPARWLSVAFNAKPEAAVKFFQEKGLRQTWNWWEMLAEQHTTSFTVAKMLDNDLLKTTQDAVEYAMAQGYGKEWLQENLVPEWQKAGWWGKQLTPEGEAVQLGSAARLQTIFRTNMQSSYSVGQWDAIEAAAEAMPYLMYDAVDDLRTRDSHAALDNIVRPVSDPFWLSHYPPNGWNCRCSTIQLSKADLADYGLKVTPSSKLPLQSKDWTNPMTGKVEKIPFAVDPGFDYHPGKSYAAHLQKIYAQKLNNLPDGLKQAAKKAKHVPSAQEIAQEAAKAKAKAEALAAAEDAQKALDELVANPAGQTNKLKALTALQKSGKAKEMDPITLLSTVEGMAAEIQKKANLSNLVSKYKKAVIAGKTPSDGMVDAVAQLSNDKLAKVLKEIEDATQAKAAKEAAEKAKKEGLENLAMLNKGEYPDPGKHLAAAWKQIQNSPELQAKISNTADAWQLVSELGAELKAKKAFSGMLTKYKTAVLNGKKPPPAALKAYESLDLEDKLAFDDKLAAAVAKKMDEVGPDLAAAPDVPPMYSLEMTDLSSAALGDMVNSVGGKAIASKIPQIFKGGFDNADDLAAKLVAAGAGPDDAAKVVKILKADGKLPMVDGPAPVFPTLGELIDDLDDVAGSAAKKVAKAETAKPVPKTPEAEAPEFANLTQTGPQRGSNPGGKFKDPETGVEYYIKLPASEDYARNEVLAAKLYQLAGIDAPELYLIDIDGALGKGKGIASRIIDGLAENPSKLQSGKAAYDGFIADAWLANHDVVGASFDNLLMKGSKAIRVDTGGAMRYRAQGGVKANWGSAVEEIDSLRHRGTNRNAASVFGDMSQADLEASAARVLAVSDDQIRRVVKEFGPVDPDLNDELIEILIARKADIKKRFPGAAKKAKPAKVKDSGKAITKAEAKVIAESRSNGYVRPTDGGEIEDQAVLLWHEIAADGTERTVGQLKLLDRGAEKLKKVIGIEAKRPGSDASEPMINKLLDQLDQKTKEAVIGVKHRMTKGEAIDFKDIERTNTALLLYKNALTEMDSLIKAGKTTQEARRSLELHYKLWLDDLERATKKGAGEAFESGGLKILNTDTFLKPGDRPKLIEIKEKAEKAGERIETTTRHRTYKISTIEKGRVKQTDRSNIYDGEEFSAEVQEAEIDGVLFRYYTGGGSQPSSPRTGELSFYALKDQVEIIAPGTGKEAAEKVYAVLKKLGIDTRRPDPLDIEERYLMQVFYHRRDEFITVQKAAAKHTSQQSRVEFLRDKLEEVTGKKIADMPNYNPEGVYQAFGQGRIHTFRPDLDGPEWTRFQRNYRIHHWNTNGNLAGSIQDILNSGGQMAPTTDKLRRGVQIGGMSPDRDVVTGGGSYFFTRIKTTGEALRETGFVWRSRVVSRLDAISYHGDAFGKTYNNYPLKNRGSTVEQWRSFAKNSRNETNFKNSLSIFDDLEHIVAGSESQRRQVIEVFKQNGYNRWPDGRELEEVVISAQK